MVALSVSFTCSLLEAALLSLTPSQLADINAKSPVMGRIWQGFKANIEKPIAAILIANTAAHTIGASVAGSEFDRLFGTRWIWLFSLLLTVTMVQYTEILPKTLGVRFNTFIATVATRPLQLAVIICHPLIRLIHLINRPFEAGKGAQDRSTVEEISALAGLARLTRQINARQERIIQGASRLSRSRLSQIMIPLEQVSCLSSGDTMMKAFLAAHADAHTRFPVCENGDKKRILGYVNFKEMVYFMRTNPNDPSLLGVLRPIYFTDREDTAADLLEIFVGKHIHMAMVRDHGLPVGLVTLEDIVVELVGDLEDELDHLPRMLSGLSCGVWMAGGGVTMETLAAESRLPLPATGDTVSDWLTDKLGKTPRAGDIYRHGDVEFLVRRTRRNRIFEVSVMNRRLADHQPAK
ncbi:MAG: CNNM domain-containing protein [Victivallales bacterium]|nr:CNNM domain-containing protein [Victivallales bacterium]